MVQPKAPSKYKPATLTDEQKAELDRIERDAFVRFKGSFDDLEKAIGVLRLGHHVGWKPLYLIHSKKTIAKYEAILDVKLRDIFEAEGPSAGRSVAYSIAKNVSNFWKVVSGTVPLEVDDRQEFVSSTSKGS